jgi:hypothetical protein
MRTMVILVLVVFLVSAGVGWAKRPVTVQVGGGNARISLIEGSAERMPAGATEWKSLGVDDMLKDGDQVKTGDQSRMELLLPDASRLRFAGNTRFRITRIDVAKGKAQRDIKIHVALGRTWANVSQALGVKSGFELTSENAVAGVRGTVYRMNVNDDQSALVRVYDGEVAVSGGGEVPSEKGPPSPLYTTPHKIEGPKPVPGPRKVSMEEWVYIVKSMQQIRVSADGIAEPPREFTEAEDRDPWVDWNKERDAAPVQQ